MHVRRRPLDLIGLFAVLALLAPTAARAQAAPIVKPLAVEQIWSREPLIGRLPASIAWAPNGGRFLYTLPGGTAGPLDTHVFDLRTHSDRIFFRAKAEGKGSRPVAEFVWSPDSSHLAYLNAGDLWVIGANGTGQRKLASRADDPQWSPDSSRVGFVHANDIYAVSALGGRPTRYSFDGSGDQVNGEPDWVYSEELSMRHAYRWSPNGKSIAYLRFDQRPVTKFPIVDFLAADNAVSMTRYPLAGEKNSIVTVRVATPGGATRTLYSTKTHDGYVPYVGWTPQGVPAAYVLDRAQKHLRYLAFSGQTPRLLMHDRDAKFVDANDTGDPKWLADKHRFLFLSEREGVLSLYLADTKAGSIQRLTRDHRVEAVLGVDERRHVAYVSVAAPTRRDATVFAVPLRGGVPHALATGSGSHRFVMAPDARHFVRIDSAFGVPPTYTIGSTLGSGVIPFAHSASLANRGFGSYDLFTVDSKLGKLDAWMIKPPGFDPRRTYPVIMEVYGGPASPTTTDRWGGDVYLYHQALAQRGFIIFSIDGPGSQIDSAAAVRGLYHDFGPASLAGQLAGVTYLKTLPFVDSKRIGIWGWSFGGYETTYALTHAPGVWKVGVAVAPVSDWRFYDSIYTERYMGTPAQNPAAYSASSVVAAASKLQGMLLISHGTSDDNVHIANSIALIQAFILAGKQIDFMVYPRKTHGISGIPQRRHLFNHMLNYWQEHL